MEKAGESPEQVLSEVVEGACHGQGEGVNIIGDKGLRKEESETVIR